MRSTEEYGFAAPLYRLRSCVCQVLQKGYGPRFRVNSRMCIGRSAFPGVITVCLADDVSVRLRHRFRPERNGAPRRLQDRRAH